MRRFDDVRLVNDDTCDGALTNAHKGKTSVYVAGTPVADGVRRSIFLVPCDLKRV